MDTQQSRHSHVTMQNSLLTIDILDQMLLYNAALGRRVNSDKPCMVLSDYIVPYQSDHVLIINLQFPSLTKYFKVFNF